MRGRHSSGPRTNAYCYHHVHESSPCVHCAEALAELGGGKRRFFTKQRLYQIERTRDGKCVTCGKRAVEGKLRCKKHLEADAALHRD